LITAIFLPNIDILIPYFALFEKMKAISKRFRKKIVRYCKDYQEGLLQDRRVIKSKWILIILFYLHYVGIKT